jgi:trimeric autotransporter adhesin
VLGPAAGVISMVRSRWSLWASKSDRLLVAAVIVASAQGFVSRPVWAQFPPIGMIDTLVGGGNGDGQPATDALIDPRGLSVAGTGSPDLYIADGSNNRVRLVEGTSGIITTFAGTGVAGFAGDGGAAINGCLSFPTDVSVDAKGNVFVADTNNHRVRRISPSGVITTVAGNGIGASSGDNGAATQASLNHPRGVAVDQAGNLYVAEFDGNRIRKVTWGPDGVFGSADDIITTVAGSGSWGYAGDNGAAVLAKVANPVGLTLDAAGNLYIADFNNARVRKVNGLGIITTVAGSGVQGFAGDGGLALSARLSLPQRVGFDGGGNLVVLDSGNDRVRRIDAVTGIITTIAGNGTTGSGGDGGPATQAPLFAPDGLAVDGGGDLYVAISVSASQSTDNRVRLISPAGIISTVAGGGNGDFGPAIDALIDPRGIEVVDGSGSTTLYIADGNYNRVRRVDVVNGSVTTVAGSGIAGFSGDGAAATDAQLSGPLDITVDQAGDLFIADTFNNRIRRVDAQGIISTFAGTGTYGYGGDGGDAAAAALAYPYGLATDTAGNLYIADFSNNRIRKVTPQGIISTIAGTGVWGAAGDEGPAMQAQLASPTDVAVGADGSLYIADYNNNEIRRVHSDGVIERLCGTGVAGYGGDDGPAEDAQLDHPARIALDAQDNMIIGDGNGRVRRVDAATAVITTIAGTGNSGTEGDGGPAIAANLYSATGIAVDAGAHLYIAQSEGARVRVVSLPTVAGTETPTRAPTPTRTPTFTRAPTSTRAPLPTRTLTPTNTVTWTPTVPATATPTGTPNPACGDGMLEPGEQCDDGNTVDGDGCSANCSYELIPGDGRGSIRSDRRACWLEWAVVNPSNQPRTDRRERRSFVQSCTKNDQSCDFDANPNGHACEFHVVVCVNNVDPNLPACSPQGIADPIQVIRPGPLRDPANYNNLVAALQNLRDPVTGVTGLAVPVNTGATNLCSAPFSIRVPLHGRKASSAGHVRLMTLTRSLTSPHKGFDQDGLVLICKPPKS